MLEFDFKARLGNFQMHAAGICAEGDIDEKGLIYTDGSLEPEVLNTHEVAGSDEPADAAVVRGVIDLLWNTPDGIEIADFKTDVVEGAALLRRIDLYKDQLRIYAEAVRKIWDKPVQRAWLAFLHARHIEPFVPKPLTRQ